jgi:uncharacterized protein YegP (UPF0339 family)
MDYIYDPYVDDNGEHQWRVIHSNGNIIARSSEGYKNESDRDEAWTNLVIALQTNNFEIKRD